MKFSFNFQENIAKILPQLVTIQDSQLGLGAGMIWTKGGIILTNNHVAVKDRLLVSFYDGQVLEGVVVERAPEVDLAFIKVEKNGLLPVNHLKLNQAKIGLLVFAVGHPLGQMNSVSVGIISGIMEFETRKGEKKFPVIRSDVVLLPGNSGGPLISAAGEVVGVNTMIIGGDQGFAIPASVADEIFRQIKVKNERLN